MNDLANTQVDTRAQLRPHTVDERDLPEWGTAEDGRRVKIVSDERLPSLFAEWQADACQHTRTLIIRFVNAGGATMHQRSCPDCGMYSAHWVKKEDAEREGVATEWSRDRLASVFNHYRSDRESRLVGIVNAAAGRMQPVNRAANDDYLRSPAWQRRRSKVMQRAGHLCEGCLTNPATDVHHATYSHYGEEFAFQLLALCNCCHTRLHQPESAE